MLQFNLFLLVAQPCRKYHTMIVTITKQHSELCCGLFLTCCPCSWIPGLSTLHNVWTSMRSWRRRVTPCCWKKLLTANPSLLSCLMGVRWRARLGSPHLTSWLVISGLNLNSQKISWTEWLKFTKCGQIFWGNYLTIALSVKAWLTTLWFLGWMVNSGTWTDLSRRTALLRSCDLIMRMRRLWVFYTFSAAFLSQRKRINTMSATGFVYFLLCHAFFLFFL